MNNTEIKETDQYLTVSQMAQLFPAFSENSLRWLIFNARSGNGFDKVVRKIGRKVVLNLGAFKQFLNDQTIT